jgi:GT2 family glycosyltransferase
MSAPKITTIIPIRNRTGLRLRNCLASLRWQDGLSKKDQEILLVDFGSDREHHDKIVALAKDHGARVIDVRTSELWNRSRALNLGIREAAAPITFCTDADMIFAPDFLATALRRAADPAGMALVLCRCRDLPDLGEEVAYRKDDFPGLLARATMRKAMGTGACQILDTRWLRSVGGYDEKYVFWGFEDKDLVARAARAGLRPAWIHDETAMLHQWHATTKNDRLYLKYKNKLRYYLTRHLVVKGRLDPA